jgi:hypothetical protein
MTVILRDADLWFSKGWDANKAGDARKPPDSIPDKFVKDWLQGWDQANKSK